MSGYSSRIKQRTLAEITPKRQKQIEISSTLEDMVANHGGWKIYDNWLSDQYDEALDKLKTAPAEEVLEYQVVIRYIESLKKWLTIAIEEGHRLTTALISETKEGK